MIQLIIHLYFLYIKEYFLPKIQQILDYRFTFLTHITNEFDDEQFDTRSKDGNKKVFSCK